MKMTPAEIVHDWKTHDYRLKIYDVKTKSKRFPSHAVRAKFNKHGYFCQRIRVALIPDTSQIVVKRI